MRSRTEKLIQQGEYGNLFVAKDGTKVCLFKDSNCLKDKHTAIVMYKNQMISYCVSVISDKFEGSDFDICNQI